MEHSFEEWTARYMAEAAYGFCAPNTIEAKTRDLSRFVRWYAAANGHSDLRRWSQSDTQMYLESLRHEGYRPTSAKRMLATLSHFAHWVHEQPGAVFAKKGLPTRGIHVLTPPRHVSKKSDLQSLLDVAAIAALDDKRKNSRPRRNLAMITLLHLVRLPIVTLVTLKKNQYREARLLDLGRFSGVLPRHCCEALDAYLHLERPLDDAQSVAEPLFLRSGSHAALTRQQVGKILRQLGLVAVPDRIGRLSTRATSASLSF